jgi:uncharacterized protein YqkB
MCIHVENPKGRLVKKKKQFTEEIREEFKYLLHKESWQEVFLNTETNTKFNVFLDMIVYYFNKAFPLKSNYLSELDRNKLITQGLNFSSKRCGFFI